MNPLLSRCDEHERLSWKSLAALAGLLLVGALAVCNRVELGRLAEADPAAAREARLQALAARVDELAGDGGFSRNLPDTVPLTRFETERELVERRLSAIEQAMGERATSDEIQPLRERLARLEEGLARPGANPAASPTVNPVVNPVVNPSVNPVVNPSVPPVVNPAASLPANPAAPPPAPRAKLAEPSFRVIGIERRADERFLSILPGRTDSLALARLLRVGDTADGWRLDAIEESSATFSQA
ncbi:MAG: hypothetical protein LBQ62_05665, partial [Candidatus Accumulibacter sp.]|nr:hypothetical protein [Accumulibacter sp.]